MLIFFNQCNVYGHIGLECKTISDQELNKAWAFGPQGTVLNSKCVLLIFVGVTGQS